MSTTLDQPAIDTDIEQQFRSIIDNEESVEDDGTGDHERFSHYVNKEDIVRSSMTGQPVYALCGKKWTPSRSPEGFPICPECKEMHSNLPSDD